MKKLIIVSTRASVGKGGISTALSGYLSGLQEENIDFEFVESHWHGTNILISWVRAFYLVTKYSLKYRSNAVFWFHLGPWLSMIRKFTLAIIPRIVGATTIAHIHSPAFSRYIKENKKLTKFSLLPYNKLIVLTPWWKSFLVQEGITKPIVVSPNPSNKAYCITATNYLSTPIQERTPSNEIKLLTMARMADGKNIDIVIKALNELPSNCILTIAGDGPLLQDYKELVNSLKLNDQVSFTGWIDGEQKELLLKEADIFCLPSSYDSFGMVFIEAMAFNLPVVAYGWGPIKDVVTPDVGECCDEPTVENLVNSVNTVLKQINQYDGKGPAKVLSLYQPKIVVENIIKSLK